MPSVALNSQVSWSLNYLRKSACLQCIDHHFTQQAGSRGVRQPFSTFLRVLMVAHQSLKGSLQRPGLFHNCSHNDLCMLLVLVLLQLRSQELVLFHTCCRAAQWLLEHRVPNNRTMLWGSNVPPSRDAQWWQSLIYLLFSCANTNTDTNQNTKSGAYIYIWGSNLPFSGGACY